MLKQNIQMNCIIVDDDRASRMVVAKCIERTDSLELVGEYDNAIEAINAIKKEKIDLIFLDIEMPEMSGMEFIESVKDLPQVIFITSKTDYAADAFNYNVTDYIVKPINYARFTKAIEKAESIVDSIQVPTEKGSTHLFVKTGTTYVRLDLDNIVWIEALGDYVNIYTNDSRHTILSTMKTLEAKLPPNQFVRIHRSYIVSLSKINEIEDNTASLGDKVLPVSRHYKENLMQRLELL